MYPISYEADFNPTPNRATTFFRLLLAIPWLIVAIFWGILFYVTHLIAWVAVIILGRYPQWLYNFNSGVVRFLVRVSRLDLPADRRVAAVRPQRRPQLPDPGQLPLRRPSARAGSRPSSA